MKISELRGRVRPDGSIHLNLPGKHLVFRCLVDAYDWRLLREKCRTIYAHETKRGSWYAVVSIDGRQDFLHRIIAGIQRGDRRVVDHRNTDTMDCRRGNLRIVTRKVNALNRRASTRVSGTQLRGIYRHAGRKWRAQIYQRRLGAFSDPRDAANAVWMALIQEDPVAATNYLLSLPKSVSEIQ